MAFYICPFQSNHQEAPQTYERFRYLNSMRPTKASFGTAFNLWLGPHLPPPRG
ncbi:hypothetical protein DPMN_063770 [Dreissena polymorpha]|uniref:Uncharacterized protein n=1 Tax=Dreissena polymorpha TaxID=45954 RepID=A0A9D4HLH2_DREPO|nr:hypothetical protein DPMN_063770 [Dreissena polymorpha]